MRTIEIPGGIAKIKDRSELRGRDSKLIKAAALAAQDVLARVPDEARPKPGESEKDAAKRMDEYLRKHPIKMTADEGMRLLDMKEAVMVSYLASWTLDLELPTIETIGDLPDDVYQALDAATGGEVINTAVSSANFDVNPDPSSPTGPSSSSSSSLRAEPSPDQEQIQSSSNGTDHSSGEGSSTPQKISTTTP